MGVDTDGTVKCFTHGCTNRIGRGHAWNGYDLWCRECHIKARGLQNETPTQAQGRKVRAFQKRVFGDGRAGKID